MNKENFFFRHTEHPVQKGGKPLYEEDFYVSKQHMPKKHGCLINCYAFGDCLWRKGFVMEGQRSQGWSIEHIIDGNAVLNSDNQSYKLVSGDLILRHPWQNISMRPGLAGYMRKQAMVLTGEVVRVICESSAMANSFYFPNVSGHIKSFFYDCKALIINDKGDAPEKLSVIVFTLLQELNKIVMPEDYPDALNRALAFINNNPCSPLLSLEWLCSECGLSISTLSRLFRQFLNTSPVNYIIDQKLEHAAALLNLGNITIQEVSDMCGYRSASFFSRAFKQKYGVAPSKFR